MVHEELPDAELEVLATLWHGGPATAREIRDALDSFRPMGHAAVFTLLTRLEAKGMVARKKADTGKAFIYRARVRPNRTYRKKVDQLLHRVFRGESMTLVSSLFESQPPSEQQLEELQAMLDRLRQQSDEPPSGVHQGGQS